VNSSSDSESVESDSSDEHPVAVQKNVPKSPAKSNVDLLLELDDCEFLKLLYYVCIPNRYNVQQKCQARGPATYFYAASSLKYKNI